MKKCELETLLDRLIRAESDNVGLRKHAREVGERCDALAEERGEYKNSLANAYASNDTQRFREMAVFEAVYSVIPEPQDSEPCETVVEAVKRLAYAHTLLLDQYHAVVRAPAEPQASVTPDAARPIQPVGFTPPAGSYVPSRSCRTCGVSAGVPLSGVSPCLACMKDPELPNWRAE
ncbi:MAG: hypothetical protein WC869_08275 [Phycisphaerae bacterium]